MCANSVCGAAHELVAFDGIDGIESAIALVHKMVFLKSFNYIYIQRENRGETKLGDRNYYDTQK